MSRKAAPGLTAEVRDRLITQTLERRSRQSERAGAADEAPLSQPVPAAPHVAEKYYRFDLHPGYQQLRLLHDGAARLGIEHPYFRQHDGIAAATTRIGGREFINFASYNYLGLAGDPDVGNAAKAAIDRYGTSVSASRSVSGERSVHRQLERALADAYEVADAVTMVSGHATNVTTIGYLFGPRDLVVHDALIHNSALQGIELSGARRLAFPHNDWAALDALLAEQRRHFERVLIVVEGIYSMDGDFPDLPRLIEIKRRHHVFLMVDEAHSFGVMGATGLGIREHFGVAGSDVDIWMGTLSKSLAGCGGFIAGDSALVEHLKFLAPGFLYSVGMPPPVAAASLAALAHMRAQPERVRVLQARGRLFLDRARAAGIDTGSATGFAVIPAITRSSVRAVHLAQNLFERGINAQPILYPAVPEQAARLRFFISCLHTETQIEAAVDALADESRRLQ